MGVVRQVMRQRISARPMLLGLVIGALGLFCLTLVCGRTCAPISEVVAVLAGRNVPGTSFLVQDLRLPRALLSAVVGCSFGLGGASFQIMLRNPLASPDIIGISAGAGAAAVFLSWCWVWQVPQYRSWPWFRAWVSPQRSGVCRQVKAPRGPD